QAQAKPLLVVGFDVEDRGAGLEEKLEVCHGSCSQVSQPDRELARLVAESVRVREVFLRRLSRRLGAEANLEKVENPVEEPRERPRFSAELLLFFRDLGVSRRCGEDSKESLRMPKVREASSKLCLHRRFAETWTLLSFESLFQQVLAECLDRRALRPKPGPRS